jgi:hypothetical protein
MLGVPAGSHHEPPRITCAPVVSVGQRPAEPSMWLELTMVISHICEQRLCNARRPRESSHPPGGSEGDWLGGRRATNRSGPLRHSPLWRTGPELCRVRSSGQQRGGPAQPWGDTATRVHRCSRHGRASGPNGRIGAGGVASSRPSDGTESAHRGREIGMPPTARPLGSARVWGTSESSTAVARCRGVRGQSIALAGYLLWPARVEELVTGRLCPCPR